jgi:hypothetical protein
MQTTTNFESSRTPQDLEYLPLIPEPSKLNNHRLAASSSEDDFARALLVFLVPALMFEVFLRAVSRGFWFDEVLTILVSRQPHVSDIWNLLTHGVDGHPMGIYLIDHVLGRIHRNRQWVYRLPAMASFLCVMACMFSFTRKRAGDLIALISTAALLFTTVYDPFAFEARSYGPMLACIAMAFFCYDRIDSKKWALFFGVSLAGACSFHFYACLAFFPFGLAELVYIAEKRKFRPQVWLGFVLGALPLPVFWPIVRAQGVLYGAHFWAVPNFWHFLNAFGEISYVRPSFSFAVFVAALFFLGNLIRQGDFRSRPTSVQGLGYSPTDLALMIGFLIMPVVTLASAKVAHGGFSGRYMLVTCLGMSMALGLFLTRLKRTALLSVALCLVCMFIFQETLQWRSQGRSRSIGNSVVQPELTAKRMNLPLVVSNGLMYLPMWYNDNSDFKSRIFFLADPQEQVSVAGTDTSTLLLMTLKNYVPVNVMSLPEFAQQHDKFLLYSNGDDADYWPRSLVRKGYSLKMLDTDPPVKDSVEGGSKKNILYLVTPELDAHL